MSKFGAYDPGAGIDLGIDTRRSFINAGYDRKTASPISPCRNFTVPEGQEVQINVVAFMYYKGQRITKVIDTYRKELHAKITQELHALNMGLEGTDHYAYVSICSPKDRR